MKAQPLPKAIYEKAVELGVEHITLYFSGGNDEGYLEVSLDVENEELSEQIESWAWDVYGYNGAGDGTDYGDNIYYNVKEKTVHTEEWFYERSERGTEPEELEIEESENE